MSKRNRFEVKKTTPDSLGGMSARQLDQSTYGPDLVKGYFPIQQVDIMKVRPSVDQPRRSMPSEVRKFWRNDAESVEIALQKWWELVEQERHAAFDIYRHIEEIDLPDAEMSDATDVPYDGMVSIRRESMGPYETAFLDLVALAGSIYRNGLNNPITVIDARDGQTFILETGERRWLAYQLLHLLYDRTKEREDDWKWRHITARILAGKVNVWRQAAENNARDDLNAIGKARQLALLLMELRRQEPYNNQFQSYDEIVPLGGCDRVFYAQVADGNEHRIPRGKSEVLLQGTGIINPQMLREYRALLRLPDEVWIWADDKNWTLGFLRNLLMEAQGDDTRLVELAQNNLYTVYIETVSVQSPRGDDQHKAVDKAERSPRSPTIDTFITRDDLKLFKSLHSHNSATLQSLKPKKRQELAELTDQAIARLMKFKEALSELEE